VKGTEGKGSGCVVARCSPRVRSFVRLFVVLCSHCAEDNAMQCAEPGLEQVRLFEISKRPACNEWRKSTNYAGIELNLQREECDERGGGDVVN
jgi:hypothetical protein